MKTNARNLMMVIAAAALTACTSTDMYDQEGIELNTKATYAENFVKKYPNVDLNQSWDFSHKYSAITLPSMNKARTRAAEGSITNGSWYEVDNNTLDWMHEKLTEAEDHRDLGKPFKMQVPDNDFTIVPIFQGQAGAMWNLHVVIDGVDYKVWDKINFESRGGQITQGNVWNEEDQKYDWKDVSVTYANEGTIQIKDADSDDWHGMHGQWFGWGYGHWNSLYNTDGSDRWTPDWKANNKVTAVRSIPITFKNFPVGAEMYFYLDITVDGNDRDGSTITKYRNSVGDQMSSLKGMMLALTDCPVPANLTGNQAMIVGCEDADGEASDWDMNDLVLLVYGETIPQPITIKEGDEIDDVKTVRYMIEDLGATDDFDFNDIVVDVSEIRSLTPTYIGDKVKWTQTGYRQEAVIRHLGGILPFKLRIGNTQLAEHEGVLGSDPDEKYEVTGWDIQGHNISVQVQQNGNDGVYNNVVFPKKGEAPMIIAVDPSQPWMSERTSVPAEWFYIPEDATAE